MFLISGGCAPKICTDQLSRARWLGKLEFLTYTGSWKLNTLGAKAPMGCLGQSPPPNLACAGYALAIFSRWPSGSNQNLAEPDSVCDEHLASYDAPGYAPRYALNLKLSRPVLGSLPLNISIRWICAGHIPRSSSGTRWHTAKIPPDSMWSKGMRQAYVLPTRPH